MTALGHQHTPQRSHHLPPLLGSVAALALLTLVNVLWFPIDQAATERADNANWDTSLLLPHQFLITAALLAAWLSTAVVVIVSAVGVHRDRSTTRRTYAAKTSA